MTNEQVADCFSCHNPIFLSNAGKLVNLYCEECYLKKLEFAINDWKNDYRRWRNGMATITKDDIAIAPRLSLYIN